MQIHQPTFPDCSSLRRISACNACSRPMSWYLVRPSTGNHSRRLNSWIGIDHSLETSASSFYSSGCCQWLPRDSASWKGEQNCILKVKNEKGKQQGPKELESGETALELGGGKQGKKDDIVRNFGGVPSASKATAAAKNPDSVWSRDTEEVRTGNANIQQRAGDSVEGREKRNSSKATSRNSPLPSVPSSAKADATETGTPRVLVSGSLPTQTRALLQPEESLGSPLWHTFASNASGVWSGVGAAFSPATAEMETVSVGEKNERLHDVHIKCTVQTAEVTNEEKAIVGLQRRILRRVDNPHGEHGLGQKTVQDIDRDGDSADEISDVAINFRGEAGEATLLGEIDSSLELVGAEEIESVEQGMLSVPWQDGESYLLLTELEDSDAPAVPAVPWDSELSAGGELGIGWEQGEGALGNPEVPEQVTLEQINEEWKSIVEQNNERMDKQWEDVEKIEDGPEIFGTEGGLTPNSMTTPAVQLSTAEMADDVSDIVSSSLVSKHGSTDVISSGTCDAWDDVMEDDFMGQEDGLVFFEDGSYSRGPLKMLPQASNDNNNAFTVEHCLVWGGHKRLRVVHTVRMDGDGDQIQVLRVVAYDEEWMGPASSKFASKTGAHSLVPLSQRPRLSPNQLTGKWKLFAVTASVVYPSSGKPAVAYSCMETSVTRTLPDILPRGECEDEGALSEVLYLPGGISASLEIKHNGAFTVGAGWLLEDRTRVSVERDYDREGRLIQVRSHSEIKGDWVGGRM